MSNFLSKNIENFKKNKEKYYTELGYEVNQGFSFFKPYQSFSDFGQELGSLPIKLWTCLLQAIIDLIYLCGFLTYYSLTMLFPCPMESADYLSQSLVSLSSALYFATSAVIDTLATVTSLITRSCASLLSLVFNSPVSEQQDRHEVSSANNVPSPTILPLPTI